MSAVPSPISGPEAARGPAPADPLGFRPADPERARTLTPEAVERYNREGFVAPFAVFDADEIAALRATVDRWMRDLGPDGAYGINCYQARLATLWDVATDGRIVDLVADIVGPDVLCWASAILSKAPHDSKRVPWHQDAGFWSLAPARTVTVWLAIDDADEGNSAMRFIPRTHDRGEIAMGAAAADSVFHRGIADAEALGAPYVNALRAGAVSLHADMLVHGSEPNRSDRRRCGLTLRYCPPSVRITDPAWARGVEAILCRGEAGDWRTHERPEGDDIRATASPHVVGNN